mgnify:CR=1 FL=1
MRALDQTDKVVAREKETEEKRKGVLPNGSCVYESFA